MLNLEEILSCCFLIKIIFIMLLSNHIVFCMLLSNQIVFWMLSNQIVFWMLLSNQIVFWMMLSNQIVFWMLSNQIVFWMLLSNQIVFLMLSNQIVFWMLLSNQIVFWMLLSMLLSCCYVAPLKLQEKYLGQKKKLCFWLGEGICQGTIRHSVVGNVQVEEWLLRVVQTMYTNATETGGSDNQKDLFYRNLKTACVKTHKHQNLIVVGAFNATTNVATYKSCQMESK